MFKFDTVIAIKKREDNIYMLFKFVFISQVLYEILSFLPMQICHSPGIGRKTGIFAGKSVFFIKNKKHHNFS